MNARARVRPLAIRGFSIATGLLLLGGLQACGGGGDDAAPTPLASTPPLTEPMTANVKLYITDNFDREHDEVWVSLQRITAVNQSGESTLVQYEPGLVVNLPTLRRTGQWLGEVTVPTNLHSVRIYLEPTAKLQALDGSIKTATIVTEGGFVSLPVDDWNWRSGTLAVDFDLARFVLQGDVLTVATRIASEADQRQWTLRYADIKGQLTARNDNRITLRTGEFGNVTINTDANTTFRSQQADWLPSVGSDVKIKASKIENGTLIAQAVSDRSEGNHNRTVEVEGQVTAIRGDQITVDVTQSKAMTIVGSLTFNAAQAKFTRGSLSVLQVTQIVEADVRQLPDGSWEAKVIEIEGARKNDRRSDDYSTANGNPNAGGDSGNTPVGSNRIELAGPLTRVDTSTQTISLLGVDVQIDGNTRLFDDVTDQSIALADLRSGDFIDVYARPSSTNSSNLVATVVERYPNRQRVEAEGLGANWANPSFSVAGVRVVTNANTLFEDGDRRISASEFFVRGPGQRIEVEGRWDGTALIADFAEIYPAIVTGSAVGSDDNNQNTARNDSDDSDYAELKGLVRARADDLVTLEVIYAEYIAGVRNGSRLDVNLAGAHFTRGSLSCLEAGAPVEIKGYVDESGTFRAVRVQLEGPCGGPQTDSGSSSGGSVFVEAEGTIIAISPNQFTLSVFYIDDLQAPAPATITVTYDATTLFRQIAAQDLRAGMFVEIYGTLTGNVLRASRVEPD